MLEKSALVAGASAGDGADEVAPPPAATPAIILLISDDAPVDRARLVQIAERAADAIRNVRDVILPFPGGIVRSGSKVGSRYKKLKASTNDAYCPTIGPLTKPETPRGTAAVYELVVDGLSFDAVRDAMKAGLHAAAACPGLTLITAGNYGGKLGPHHFALRDLL